MSLYPTKLNYNTRKIVELNGYHYIMIASSILLDYNSMVGSELIT